MNILDKTQKGSTIKQCAKAFFALAIMVMVIPTAMGMSQKYEVGNNTMKPLNERFESLQDYLDWKNNSRMADIPKYQEISPGRFKFRRSRGQARDDRIYSYEELRDKLGFAK